MGKVKADLYDIDLDKSEANIVLDGLEKVRGK